ncbi:MAG: RHS repeat domain-containing protein [Bacteroidales bacterium]
MMYLVSPLGVVLEEYAHDAWGRRCDPATWKAFTGTAATARGFTGHEHIDLFELVNMNGRVYAPCLGRFLSPDSYVQGHIQPVVFHFDKLSKAMKFFSNQQIIFHKR